MDKREPCLVPEWLRTSAADHSNHILSSDSSSKTRTCRDFDSGRGFTKHTYRSRERNSFVYIDPWDLDTIPPASYYFRKDQDQLPQGFTLGFKNGGTIDMNNGQATFPAKSCNKSGFDKDFPSLRVEERNEIPDNVTSSSPPVQSLPVGNSPSIVVEGRASALAEIPNVIHKTGACFHPNVCSLPTLTGSGRRNMAEALVQAPVGTGTLPQGSVKTQTLEDRAIKQSRQLIPVVPLQPKGTVLKSSDKSKARPVVRNGESGLASFKNTQQQSSMLLGNPGCQVKPDTSKKLVVLKPARENVVAAVKESGTSIAARTAALSTQVMGISGASANMIAGKTVAKNPSLAQMQSRNAFFSALKAKTSTNFSTDASKVTSCIFSSVKEKASSLKEFQASNPSSAQAAKKDDIMETAENVSEVEERNNGFESGDRPDEKEAEFLRSLGWDESNSEESEAITEEEIRAFIEQYKKLKPSLVQRLPMRQEATEEATPDS